jgi:PKD repeat protein
MKKILLFVLILFAFQSLLNAQEKITLKLHKTDTRYTALSKNFRSYQIFKIDSVIGISQSAKQLIILVDGKSAIFHGHHNTKVSDGNLFVHDRQGNTYDASKGLVHFNGTNSIGGNCRMSFNNGFILGTYVIDKEEYNVEQVLNFIQGSNQEEVVIYKTKDIIDKNVKCGNTEEVNELKEQQTAQPPQPNTPNGICRVIDYAIAVDYTSYVNHGSSIEQTTNYILSIMNLVEGNYVGIFNDDLYYKVSEIMIFTSPEVRPWTYNTDIITNLSLFTGWAASGFSKPFDDASYWYAEPGVGQSVGYAWLGTTCSTNGYNTNVIREYGESSNIMRCLVAHEIGHNFSCAHTNGFIMNAYVGNYNTWAPESIVSVNSQITGNGGSCISACNYTSCEKLQAANVNVTDNGTQLTVSWTANTTSVKVEYRKATTGVFTLVGQFSSPANTTTIAHDATCNVTEYFQIRVTPICPNTNTGVPTIIVKQSVGSIPPLPSITIANSSAGFCANTSTAFTATIANGGSSPYYQWKINGTNTGTNSATFNTSTLNNNDVVTCVLTSSLSCVAANNITSNTLSITVNPPVANFNFSKNALVVNFTNTSSCGITYLWYFGDGTTSTQESPTHTYSANGMYNVCLTITNGNSTSQKCMQIPVFNAWLDNLNDATDGTAQAITYQNSQCDRASEFKNNSSSNPQLNSSIEYPFKNFIPNKGTIEFLVNITGGYGSFGLSPNSGTLFQIGRGFVGSQVIRKLEVYSGGTINFVGTVGGTYHTLQASGTPFAFNSWHVVSVSYGAQGYKIAVDGLVRASNALTIANMDSGRVQLGEIWYPGNSRWEGVTGLVDKVRFSYTEGDFQLSLPTQPPTATITTSANSICPSTSVTFTATTNAPTANYQWKKNGVNVGTNSATYTDNSLANGNTINCMVTATSGCFGTPNATSNTITMVVTAAITPSISIVANRPNPCVGETVTYTASAVNVGSSPTYSWRVNGNSIGFVSNVFTSNILVNGDVVTCTVTPSAGCYTSPTASSNTITMTVRSIVTPTASIVASANNICAGTNIIFTATTNITAASYQWKRNGANVGSNSNVFSSTALTQGDLITCTITAPAADCYSVYSITTNPITITVNPVITQTALISASANNICPGTSITFSAITNAATANYQWKKNGIVVGANSSRFTNSSWINGDQISCIVTALSGCFISTPTTSNVIVVSVVTTGPPSTTISASQNNICPGTPVTFTAVTNAATAIFQWKKNGANVGANSNAYNDNSLVNNDLISCVVTASSGCQSTAPTASNTITMAVLSPITPAISITATRTNPCVGEAVTFTATPNNGGTLPNYQWKVNGSNAGTNSTTFTSSTLNNGDMVTCVLTPGTGCYTSPTASSNSITMNVRTIVTPTRTITASVNNICAGTSVIFTSATNIANPQYFWKVNNQTLGTNSTFTTATLNNGDVVNCIIIAPSADCYTDYSGSSNSIIMVVNPLQVLTSNITASQSSICQGASSTFYATTNATSANYQWKVNGNNLGTNSSTFIYLPANGDLVTCTITPNAGCFTTTKATSNTIAMSVTTPVTPSVNISATRTNPCIGESITFTATPANAGLTPTYQWKRNGINIASGVTYTANGLTNGDIISCVLTASPGCYTQTTATSNSIIMNVRPIIVPTAQIISNSTSICANFNVIFTATTNIANASYQWKLNGNTVGTNSNFYNNSTLANNDAVTCTVTAPAADCYTSYSVTSNTVSILVKPLLTPALSIISNDVDNIICSGQPITMSASVINGGISPAYQWKRNGQNVGANSNVYAYIPTNGDVITALVTTSEACVTDATVSSNAINIIVPQIAPTIIKNGYTLAVASVRPGASFQWFKDGLPIANATNPAYDATLFGSYTVQETNQTCNKQSAAIQILPFGFSSNQLVTIYPNPTTNSLFVQTNSLSRLIRSWTVYDAKGRMLVSGTGNNNILQIKTAMLPAGIYVLDVQMEKEKVIRKFVKQ